MFRTAELQHKLPKEEYHQQVPQLREELLLMQMELRNAPFPVIVVFAGVDGAGKSETVNKLHEWLDSRWLVTRAFGEPSDEELDRPEYWRFWRELPSRGRMGLFLSSWYSMPILDRVFGRIDIAEFDERLERINIDMLPAEIVGDQTQLGAGNATRSLMAMPLREARENFEREYLRIQIRRFSGNISRTATFIGMERSALHRKLKILGLVDIRGEDEE